MGNPQENRERQEGEATRTWFYRRFGFDERPKPPASESVPIENEDHQTSDKNGMRVEVVKEGGEWRNIFKPGIDSTNPKHHIPF